MELVKSLKQSKLLKYVFLALIGSIVLAISSKIKIPFYPVPMTMQTLVVLMIGIGFGWKLGLATVSLYLFEGIIGLPVFSGTPEKGIGLLYFTGPTMGYLLGFLVAVYISGKFFYDSNLIKNFLKLLLATSFIYILGISWLGNLSRSECLSFVSLLVLTSLKSFDTSLQQVVLIKFSPLMLSNFMK